MQVDSGNVVAAKMSAHRHQWNGTICAQPQSWNCGADPNFRADYCDSGAPRCFHLDVFKPNAPRFITPDSGVVLAVQRQPGLFDDQILVFYGGRFGAQQGIAQGDYEQSLYGFYRVKHGTLDTTRPPFRLIIEPHPDAWAVFPRMHLRPSALRSIQGVGYLKQVRAKCLKDAIDEACEAAESIPKSDGWNTDLQNRLRRAGDSLPGWLQKAKETLSRLSPAIEAPRRSVSFGVELEGPLAAKLRGIKILTTPSVQATIPPPSDPKAPEPEPLHSTTTQGDDVLGAEETKGTPVDEDVTSVDPLAEGTAPGGEAGAAGPRGEEPFQELIRETGAEVSPVQARESLPTDAIPEPRGQQILEKQFGHPLVEALSVAFTTKNLVILTGAPGAGKSWIASHLLDDSARERTVIVPVASTWRGREDLMGYVNPITANFEATEFTHFLCDAQQAWEAGDHRTRLVVFEEFNLSQPEHWLSDLLVRLEYDANQLADRTVRLGGNAIAGRPEVRCSVVLVPSLRFAATLNSDHTVKPLSPRVLDRAALIEVTSSGRAALSRAGVELGDDVEDVIDELNDILEPRGAAFSVRSARSLRRAMEAASTSGMGLARVLDLVLAQEVLSRVRLLAGDPRDEQLLMRLQAWTQKPGCSELSSCASRVADWGDLLSAGRDVFQA
jgi:hypothetical protein